MIDTREQSVSRYAPRRKRPSAAGFIAGYVARNGSFRGDVFGDRFHAAAVKLAASDPTLELVDSPSKIRQHGKLVTVPGWELRRKEG